MQTVVKYTCLGMWLSWLARFAHIEEVGADAAICCLMLWLTCGEQTAREYFEFYLKRNGSCSSDAITTLLPFAASMLYNRENAAGKKLLLSIMK